MTHSRKIFSGVNCWGKLLSWYFILFFFFSPFSLSLALPYPSSVRKLFICFGVEKGHTPIGSPSDGGSLFRGIKGVGFQFQFDRANQRWESEDGRGKARVAVHFDATWYMRVAATSKPKGITSALLISDMLEVHYITAC